MKALSKESLLLLILASIQFAHIIDFMIIMPLGPQMMRVFEITPTQFSWLVSSYEIAAGIMGLVGAFMIDRFDRKTTLTTLFIGFTIGTFLCAVAPNFHFLLITRCVTGAFGGVLGAVVLAVVGDAFEPAKRSSAMGTVMAAFSAASVFGVPFGLAIATYFNWRAPFIFLGVLSILVLIGIYLYVPNMKGHFEGTITGQNSPKVVFGNVIKNKNQQKALLFMVLLMFGQFTIIPFISMSMVNNVGFTEAQLTFIYLLGGGATIFTSPAIGRLADRKGNLLVYIVFAILNLIPLYIITNLGHTPIYYVLMVTTLFFIFSGGRMIPAMSMITASVLPQNRGSFMSMNSAVQQLAAAISASVGGAIIIENSDGSIGNYEYVGYIALFCSVLAILVSRTLKPIS